MRTKLFLLIFIFIAIISISLNNNKKVDYALIELKSLQDNYSTNNYGQVKCDGEVYTKYLDFDILNPEITKILKSLPKLDVNKDFLWGGDIYKRLPEIMFSSFKKNFNKNNIFSDYKTRIDGAKILWAPMYLLPSNGKFIMLVMQYWDEEFDARSSGYFLCTFKLNGELLSMVYAYGQEELDNSSSNKELLNLIWGKTYCLNTNRPIVRKAINWDIYDNRNGFNGTTLEVKELKYFIDEQGNIKLENEKAIFPKRHVEWKERSGISFNEESDTIRKMLGEIE